MSVTIGARTYSYLTAFSAVSDGKDVTAGLTARRWKLSGLLTETEWQNMVADYESWRATRLTEPDSIDAGSVGTTVLLSSDEGVTITNVPCWYYKAPEGSREGTYWNTGVEMIDAAQALEAALATEEKAIISRPYTCTITLGGATIELVSDPDGFIDPPKVERAADGSHIISGPMSAVESRDVEGYVSTAGLQSLRTWYVSMVASTPSIGSWYPQEALKPPKTEHYVIDGLRVTRHLVKLSLVKIK